MNSSMRRRYARLERSGLYVSANAADFPAGSKGVQAAAEINDVLAEIEARETSRVTNANLIEQAAAGRQSERESLRAQLRAMSDTAKIIGLDHPEVRGTFKFSGASMSDVSLLATARAFLAAAQPLKARFIEYDMPADFYDRLESSIANFARHMDTQTVAKGGRISDNASLEQTLRRGETALERLNTAVHNKYRDDPAKLAAWESASHLERPARKKNGAGNGDKQNGGGNNTGTP